MFFKSGHRKSSNPLLSLFRLIMSVFIIAVLGLGLLQAYKAFSGYDPMKLDPESLKGLMTSDSAYQTLIGLLTFDPKKSVGIGGDKQSLRSDDLKGDGGNMGDTGDQEAKSDSPVKFKFAVMADSHKDTVNLEKALNQAKEAGVKFVIMMGDLSDVGTIEELTATKQTLDASGLQYYTAAGDHDLWDSRDKENNAPKNFKEVFGITYQSFSYDTVRYILIYNSDNYSGLDGVQLQWVEDEMANVQNGEPPKLIFAFAPTPLYHPSSDHVMGKVTPKLTGQADHLITTFKKGGVDLVFSADTHFFSKYTEPKNDLDMVTVGAVTSDRNPQAPRFALVEVLEDGNYNIEETEIK